MVDIRRAEEVEPRDRFAGAEPAAPAGIDDLDAARRAWLDSLSGEISAPDYAPAADGAGSGGLPPDARAPHSGRHDPGRPRRKYPFSSPRAHRRVRAVLLGAIVVSIVLAAATFGSVGPRTTFGIEPVPDLEWACPARQPFTFTDTFGAPRGADRTHRGVDLFGEKGSPISSVVSGDVVKSVKTDDGTLGGARVWVAGDDGWWYYYAHLDSVVVDKGERVETGEKLGTMGNTGNAASTPTHLHLEQHFGGIDGPFVNPYAQISALC